MTGNIAKDALDVRYFMPIKKDPHLWEPTLLPPGSSVCEWPSTITSMPFTFCAMYVDLLLKIILSIL